MWWKDREKFKRDVKYTLIFFSIGIILLALMVSVECLEKS